MSAWEFFKELVNPESIIRYGGVFLLFAVVFAETGLLVGFFLPGDSLLFTAGLLTATQVIDWPIHFVVFGIFASAILGDFVGYHFGKRVGNSLYQRKESWYFKPAHLASAKEFYDKHGGKAIVMGRFLPVIRTFAPIIAGIVRLDYFKFVQFNLLGAFLWTVTLVYAGYYLGLWIPNIQSYLSWIIIGMVVLTTIPVWRSIRKATKKSKE